jgi:hypothetical protein
MKNDYANNIRRALIAGQPKTFQPQADRNEVRLAAAKARLGDNHILARPVRRITPHNVLRLVTRTGSVSFVA